MTAVRSMPSSDDSEREVLGVCLLSNSVVECAAIVDAVDFYHPAHKPIWEAMVELDRSQRPIDTLTVEQQMRAVGTFDKLAAFGGADYLVSIQGLIVSVENVAYHAGVVAKKAERRRWIAAGTEIAAAGYGEDDDDAFMARAESAILARSTAKRIGGGPKHIKTGLRSMVNNLGERVTRKKQGLSAVTGIPTGLEEWDVATAGLHPSDLVILAARPSMGKTSLARRFAEGAAKHGCPTLFFSLEMSTDDLVEQMVASGARVDSQRMRRGDIEIRHWNRIHGAIGDLVGKPLYIDDYGSPTVDEIRSKARRWRSVDVPTAERVMIIVDYLQLVKPSAKKHGNREQEVAEVSRGLKLLAKELKCPVIALSQLNRGLENREDKRPKMSDLRESGAIEQDADVVAFIYRDEVYSKEKCRDEDKGVAEVIIAKQRKGPLNTCRVAWLAQYVQFENLSPRDDA